MVPKAVEKKRKREEPESETEDQSAALLKGFESSGEEDASGEERFKQGQDVPALPDANKLNKKLKLANKQGEGVESGVVYVGYVR
jgi:nucleolar protein 15